jgi:hypothetical protein
MYSRASQRPKFTAPFVSPTMNNSMKPSTQERQLGRDEKTQNDIIGVTHECYQGLTEYLLIVQTVQLSDNLIFNYYTKNQLILFSRYMQIFCDYLVC